MNEPTLTDEHETKTPESGLKPIFVRATPAEKSRIQKRAKACRMSASRFLARAGADGRFPPTTEEREDLRALRLSLANVAQALGGITSRLELARRGREVEIPSTDEIQQATRLAKSLSQAIARRLKL